MTEPEKKISVPVSLEMAEKLEARASLNGRAVGREVQKILEAAFPAKTRVAPGSGAARRRKPSTKKAA